MIKNIPDFVQQIEDSFSKAIYPGDENIGRDEIKKFRGHWKSIPLDTIIRSGDLPFFSERGFHYYLPAFLNALLLHHNEVGSLHYNVISSLIPPDEPRWSDAQFDARAKQFTPEQRLVIHDFLISYNKLYPEDVWSSGGNLLELQRAIEYWGRT